MLFLLPWLSTVWCAARTQQFDRTLVNIIFNFNKLTFLRNE